MLPLYIPYHPFLSGQQQARRLTWTLSQLAEVPNRRIRRQFFATYYLHSMQTPLLCLWLRRTPICFAHCPKAALVTTQQDYMSMCVIEIEKYVELNRRHHGLNLCKITLRCTENVFHVFHSTERNKTIMYCSTWMWEKSSLSNIVLCYVKIVSFQTLSNHVLNWACKLIFSVTWVKYIFVSLHSGENERSQYQFLVSEESDLFRKDQKKLSAISYLLSEGQLEKNGKCTQSQKYRIW